MCVLRSKSLTLFSGRIILEPLSCSATPLQCLVFRAPLVCDSDEFSLKLFRFLDIGHVGRLLEPDQLFEGSTQRCAELLNKDRGCGVVISSRKEKNGNGNLWYFVKKIHRHEFVQHQ